MHLDIPVSKEKTAEPELESGDENSKDAHDESCYVCDAGGELLCCDTCSLVFHLHCLSPKLATIPKGKWSCPYCIANVINNETNIFC